MIYFMTAFFLALNNANWLWWGCFFTMLIIEIFIGILKMDIASSKNKCTR